MAVQREWFEKDYYAVLGVPSSASAKEITKAIENSLGPIIQTQKVATKTDSKRFQLRTTSWVMRQSVMNMMRLAA